MLHRKLQTGFTVIEMVIAAAVLGVIAVIAGNLITSSMNTYQYLFIQSNNAADLTNVIDRVSKVVRGATSVVTAQSNTLTIYAYFSPNDNVVDQVTYFVSGNNLEVTVIPPSGTAPNYTYDPANGTTTVLTQNLVNTSTPVFTYYDDTGAQLPSGFSISQIAQVGIQISFNPDPKRLPVPMSNQTIVTLRNLKTNL